jgi:hypothetical protein
MSTRSGYEPVMTQTSTPVNESGLTVPGYLTEFQSTNDWASAGRPPVSSPATARSERKVLR